MKTALLAALVSAVALATGLVLYSSFSGKEIEIQIGDQDYTVPRLVDRKPRAMRKIYLHRAGARVIGGVDDSAANRSSVAQGAGLSEVTIPAFAGSDRRWNEIVACLRKQYERFDVELTEDRPAARGYVMAIFGGTPDLLKARKRVGGLAPFNGEPIEDPVVFIFTRGLHEQTRAVCETAAMEIAHTFGLDHEHTCKDPMGYLGGCGARWFQEKAYPCGEHGDRPCADGQPTQSSVARLLSVLGPRQRAVAGH